MLAVARLFFFFLVLRESTYVTSFSLSRLLNDFPRPFFFSSVSSTIRDTPKLLFDVTALNGLDGSRLQPPSRGGGGSYTGFLTNGGDEGWRKELLVMPFLKRNDTGSITTVSYRSSGETKNRLRGKNYADKDQDSMIKRWWERNTAGSKGLLIYLFPAVCAQLSILRTAVPFFLDRLSQYLQPIYMGLSFLLMQNRGASIVQATLWTSVLIGETALCRLHPFIPALIMLISSINQNCNIVIDYNLFE